jgi:hypothetical protein
MKIPELDLLKVVDFQLGEERFHRCIIPITCLGQLCETLEFLRQWRG